MVLVWERVGGVWQETARINSDSISSYNYQEFGQAMALSGNLLTVSSRRDGGRLELFEKVGATWTRVATVPTKHGSSIQRLTMSGPTVLVENSQSAQLYEFPVAIPAFPSLTLTVKEPAAFGTVVGTAGLTPLAGQSYRYEITSGNTGDVFRIDPVTGEITVKRGSSLDFETTPVYTLTVTATEASGQTVSTTVTVQLVNLAEPQSQIIDNGGTGFATTGTWTNENSGRGRSVLRTPAGNGTAQATWTFSGLTPGVYRIAATWSANSNRTTTAPYRVLVNGTQAATKTFNQRNTPTEFVQDGSGWRVIGTITVTGNDSTLVTELVNTTTTGFTIADAVRLDHQGAITMSPDIELSSGGNVLPDGTGVIDFGSGTVGATTMRDFRVTNRGSADLTIAANPSVAGTSTGTLQMVSNDGDESPYEVTLTSTRTALDQPLARITVDGVEVFPYSGTIDFGTTTSGIAVAKTVQIQNVGTGILRFPDSWLTETWSGNFEINSTGTDMELAPGESTTFVIRFLARKPGTSRDRLKTGAYWGWTDQQQASVYFNLIGHVQAGRLVLESSGPLDALPNQAVAATYTYRNTGDLATILQPATLSGSSRFTILSNFTANQSVAPGMLIQGGANSSRGVLEFDLSAIPANRPLKSAWFFFHTTSLVGGTTVSVPMDIFGYTGDGTLEAADAGLGTKIGSRPISNAGGSNQVKVHSALLDVAYVRALIGTGQLGLVLRNDGSADGVVIDTSDSAAHSGQKPYLLLQFSDLKPDLVVRDIGGAGNELLTLTSNGTSFTASSANVFGVGPWEQIVAGDFNGDGRSDLAARKTSDGTWWISLMGTTGVPEVAVSWVMTSTSTTWTNHLVSDFDGDGRSDLAARNDAGEWWIWQSTGTSLEGRNWGRWETGTTWQNVLVADVNRDGRADIAGRNSAGLWFVSLATGTTSASVVFTTSQWGLWSTATTWSDVQVGDFNGDGRADIAGRSAIGQWWVNRSTGTSFSAALYYGNWSTGTTWSDVRVADFNGDGRDDIIGRSSIGQWWLAEVATSGFVMKHLGNWSAPQSKWTDVRVGDFNRDGRADLVARNSVTHELWTSLWSPTGFITNAWVTLPDGTSRSWRLLTPL